MSLLQARNLTVEVAGKPILKKLNLSVEESETRILFGPNGSGKTSLLMALAGVPSYRLTEGEIIFQNQHITQLPLNERVNLGVGLGFQQPPEVTGVKLKDLLKICAGDSPKDGLRPQARELAEKLRLTPYLDRDVNVGFSGGERKRAEVLQLLLLKPKLLLLDEPDSGVDLESLKLIAETITQYQAEEGASALIITHQGYILEHIKAEKACVLMEGGIFCEGDPDKIFQDIKEKGYRGCVECRMRMKK
ncbi:MAG: Fe-S cluster assembly ATPase SufC [Candidatus Altiarchaeales archaeon]|nr:Fe-S cluster assembly ATPase SufC [Candidatus Altiarchaeales archaeon]